MAKASDFRFGRQLGFANAHHKITAIGKRGYGLGLGELPTVLWFPFHIYTMAEARALKFGIQLWFAKAHHKITSIGRSGLGFELGELFKLWWFFFDIYTMAEAGDFKFGTQLGFAKAHHKTTPEEKWAWPWVTKAPIYLGFPFNISATAALSS